MVLLAVADATYRFIAIHIGDYCSAGDFQVLLASDFGWWVLLDHVSARYHTSYPLCHDIKLDLPNTGQPAMAIPTEGTWCLEESLQCETELGMVLHGVHLHDHN